MSSSGLIYAGIVGAWAVYLVPVWLRREEQLNEARQKARYAAAIRTLGRTEQFEKKWLGDEELAATGTDGRISGPPPGSDERSGSGADSGGKAKGGKGKSPAAKPAVALGSVGVAAAKKTAGPKPTPASPARRPQTAATVPAAQQRKQPVVSARVPAPAPTSVSVPVGAVRKPSEARRRGVLLMRRRRVVAFLFTLATTGALVSATLGISYVWAMLAPAALFSGYIINIRRDEVRRAEERWRRRQAVLAAERRRERDRQRVEAQERPQGSAQTAAAPPTVASADLSDRYYDTQPQPYRRAANG